MPYLMDELVQFASVVRRGGGENAPVISVFPDMERRLHLTPRYLLDEGTIEAAVEIALGRPKIIVDALEHAFVPHDSMWIEWPESGRGRLREAFYGSKVEEAEAPGRPLPKRVGFLIESEPGGRSGTVTWVWNGPVEFSTEGTVPPNVAPICQYFNLDRSAKVHDIREKMERQAFLTANLASYWKSSPVQIEALLSLWDTVTHAPSTWGAEYLGEAFKRTNDPELFYEHALADVYGEYIMVWAVILLLTSSRKTVDYKKIDRTQLNKARIKKRRTPLLDHVEVTMHIGDRQSFRGQRTLDFRRKSPRIHMVSRYLARRGNKHWIVEPYLRGSGDPASLKTIHVRE